MEDLKHDLKFCMRLTEYRKPTKKGRSEANSSKSQGSASTGSKSTKSDKSSKSSKSNKETNVKRNQVDNQSLKDEKSNKSSSSMILNFDKPNLKGREIVV